MKKALLLAALLVLAAGALATGFVYSGIYNIAADEPHWMITERLITALRTRSIQARARGGAVPDLADPKRLIKGAGQYAEMCAGCHLAPGVQNAPLRQGLYPQPPDFTRRSHETDARAGFWVIKHGIKMTAMPAWGPSHDDDTIWSLVAFVGKLPMLDAEQYRAMVEKASARSEAQRR